METLARTLKTLADPGRLRLLRLLAAESLSVGELASIVGLAQPSVSRQLAALKQGGLVREERNGAYAFYRLDGDGGPLWPPVAAELHRQGDGEGDLARMADVVRRRVERGGGRGRVVEPGRSWPAWARALGHLIPPLTVADLGCGDGALTAEIARWARQVVAVDDEKQALAAARQRLRRQGCKNVRFLLQRLQDLTLDSASVDVAILSQALHHFDDAALPLAQAHRILVPGGRLLLLDLGAHGENWVKEKLGHKQLGFRREQVEDLLAAAGFTQIESEDMSKGAGQPFRILLASARRPGVVAAAQRPARSRAGVQATKQRPRRRS